MSIAKPAFWRFRQTRWAANLMLNECVEAITHEVLIAFTLQIGVCVLLCVATSSALRFPWIWHLFSPREVLSGRNGKKPRKQIIVSSYCRTKACSYRLHSGRCRFTFLFLLGQHTNLERNMTNSMRLRAEGVGAARGSKKRGIEPHSEKYHAAKPCNCMMAHALYASTRPTNFIPLSTNATAVKEEGELTLYL